MSTLAAALIVRNHNFSCATCKPAPNYPWTSKCCILALGFRASGVMLRPQRRNPEASRPNIPYITYIPYTNARAMVHELKTALL